MTQPPRRRTTQPGPGERAARTIALRAARTLAASIRTECDAIDAATDDPTIRAAVARIRDALDKPPA
ncbi:hypothetical protein STAN_1842 [Streptomyces sp. CBMAI 2042]|uniref:hypothetical protein n=1 Tax=Streptomyces sp. CBMAI 2042 TaxID=2305222 RepID=UPI000F2B4C5A|nr:hypothetical protein [Streptomyces sp. CBMAI 2042]RLV66321.1 hypothetical protein STAN_1842 [Streptomyces sp. CBMAI 2042]